jgi:hypothetical protein
MIVIVCVWMDGVREANGLRNTIGGENGAEAIGSCARRRWSLRMLRCNYRLIKMLCIVFVVVKLAGGVSAKKTGYLTSTLGKNLPS